MGKRTSEKTVGNEETGNKGSPQRFSKRVSQLTRMLRQCKNTKSNRESWESLGSETIRSPSGSQSSRKEKSTSRSGVLVQTRSRSSSSANNTAVANAPRDSKFFSLSSRRSKSSSSSSTGRTVTTKASTLDNLVIGDPELKSGSLLIGESQAMLSHAASFRKPSLPVPIPKASPLKHRKADVIETSFGTDPETRESYIRSHSDLKYLPLTSISGHSKRRSSLICLRVLEKEANMVGKAAEIPMDFLRIKGIGCAKRDSAMTVSNLPNIFDETSTPHPSTKERLSTLEPPDQRLVSSMKISSYKHSWDEHDFSSGETVQAKGSPSPAFADEVLACSRQSSATYAQKYVGEDPFVSPSPAIFDNTTAETSGRKLRSISTWRPKILISRAQRRGSRGPNTALNEQFTPGAREFEALLSSSVDSAQQKLIAQALIDRREEARRRINFAGKITGLPRLLPVNSNL